MKKEWKVFILGNKDRGDEVIKALTDLGGRNYDLLHGTNNNSLYFINPDGIICCTCFGSEIAKIIMYNYYEIKLPEKQWRDGDILFSEIDNEFAVFEVEHIHYPNKFFSHLSTCHAGYLTNQLMHKKDFRLATESEIEQFHNRLHVIINKDWWDTEKKQLVDWEWRPSINEAYYTLEIDNGDVEVRTRVYFDDDIDKKLIKNCNFFRTIKKS